jgi:hypothetical protein
MALQKIITSRFYNKFIGINDTQKILLGKLLTQANNNKEILNSLLEVEFKVFSQWGDDGIIQYLVNKIPIINKTFIEFGVETYHESNTRFLLINNNWTGLIIDGSASNIKSIKNQNIYWQYDLHAKEAFITKDNINKLINDEGFNGDIGILSVDIDGNDYWVLEAINVVNPVIIIVEYNSAFGLNNYSIPYKADFVRAKEHFSNQYWGASISAFHYLLNKKGYTFIGCNSNGNNGYFVQNDKIINLPTPSLEIGFVNAKFRDSRDAKGKLTYLSGNERINAIKGMPVIDVLTNKKINL